MSDNRAYDTNGAFIGYVQSNGDIYFGGEKVGAVYDDRIYDDNNHTIGTFERSSQEDDRSWESSPSDRYTDNYSSDNNPSSYDTGYDYSQPYGYSDKQTTTYQQTFSATQPDRIHIPRIIFKILILILVDLAVLALLVIANISLLPMKCESGFNGSNVCNPDYSIVKIIWILLNLIVLALLLAKNIFKQDSTH